MNLKPFNLERALEGDPVISSGCHRLLSLCKIQDINQEGRVKWV